MPVSHQDRLKHTIARAARLGQVLTVRCTKCRRQANYLASDLEKVLEPFRSAFTPPFPCSRCKTAEFVDVRVTVPSSREYMTMTIRRPIELTRRWRWRNVRLGDL